MMSVPKGLVQASRIMARLSLCGAVLSPVCVLAGFLFPDATRALGIRYEHLGAELSSATPLDDRLLAAVFALIPAGVATIGLWALAKLFANFARGDLFSSMTLEALRRVTLALFWYVLTSFLMQVPISYFLTATMRHRQMSLTLGSSDVSALFLAGVALVIVRAMAEARRLADENASFV